MTSSHSSGMISQDRFTGLAEFVTTVQTGSFTAAASHLGLTSSAIGKSVSRLEAKLGIKLLHRTTRRLTLTPEGQDYFTACQRILEDLDGVDMPDDLKACCERARDRGCEWIMFDRDADALPELASYDW